MKQYLLFSCDEYYPAGGWDDFQGTFDTTQLAFDFIARRQERFSHDHIVDTVSMTVVWRDE